MKYWLLLIGIVVIYEGALVVKNRIEDNKMTEITLQLQTVIREQDKLTPLMYTSSVTKAEFDEIVSRKKENDAKIERLARQEISTQSWIRKTAAYSILIRFILPQFGVNWNTQETFFCVSA